MKNLRSIFISGILLFILAGCGGTGYSYLKVDRGIKQSLRLLLEKNKTTSAVAINSPFKIESSGTSFGPKIIKIEVNSNSIIIDGNSYGARVKIIPENQRFTISGIEYRGNLILYCEDGKFNAVEDFSIEEYLYGVVGMEMSGNCPIEALKAQAVAARTFSYYEAEIRHTKEYDIDNLLQSQAFSGTSSENPNSIEAVNQTSGEVMKYNGSVIFAAFSANCGGYTEDNKEVFGIQLPYLQAVPCTFCKRYPNASWQDEISSDHIIASLRKKGIDIYNINAIEINDTSITGRVKQVSLLTDRGNIRITTNELRLAVGSNKLKSARFTVRTRGNTMIFTGKGWGHGVGMCQDGADGMARNGNSYRRILSRYYIGVEIGPK